jgi:tRNA1(Val) A37 N6-methylase TrmN6
MHPPMDVTSDGMLGGRLQVAQPRVGYRAGMDAALLAAVSILQGDVAAPFSDLGEPVFDGSLANPPFFDDPSALRGPSSAKTRAWISREGLAAWITFMTRAVRDGGDITLIHRADRLPDLLSLLSAKCGSIQVRPIQPFVDAPAKRVLVRAKKTGRGPLRLLPALVLHDRAGSKHTDPTERLLRGEAALEWF